MELSHFKKFFFTGSKCFRTQKKPQKDVKENVKDDVKKKAQKKPVFVFAEPFCFFTLPKTTKAKDLEKIVIARGKNILKTTDFFYTTKVVGNKHWCLCISARGWNERCSELKALENSYPALMHLRLPGRYVFFSESGALYLVDFSNPSDPKILLSPSLQEGYKEPTEADYLPPQFKLKWSCARKELLSAPLCLFCLSLVCLLFTGGVHYKNNQLENAILQFKQKNQIGIVKYQKRGNFAKVLKKLTDTVTKVPSGAYVTKVTYDKKHKDLVFNIKCRDK